MASVGFGPFSFDNDRMILKRDGVVMPIGGRGAALLNALVEADGKTVSKGELMEAAWPGTIVEESNLNVQIGALRKALGTTPEGYDWIVTVPRLGYRLPRHVPTQPSSAGGEGEAAPGVSGTAPVEGTGRPLVAVLPFANLSSDPEQAYFADGVVDDIITALSRFKQFAVVARNSSFVYKDRAIDVRSAARELGVRYVLEGSVRRSGDKVRVTTQLIDADDGAHIWADRFEGAVADIFDFQDRITESVVGLIEPQIRKAEIERTRRKRPENMDAYDLFLRAGPMVLEARPEGWDAAIDMLGRATVLDPGYAPAYALKGWAHEKRYTFRPVETEGLEEKAYALEMSERALALDRDDAAVLAMAAWNVILLANDKPRGTALIERALELNPNNLLVLNFAALCFEGCGDLDRAEAAYRRALRVSPGAPDAFWSLTNLAVISFFRGQYEQGIELGRQALAVNDGWEWTWGILAALYATLDRMDEAHAAMARVIAIRPHTAIEHLDWDIVRPVEDTNTLKAALRKAGAPEHSPPAPTGTLVEPQTSG